MASKKQERKVKRTAKAAEVVKLEKPGDSVEGFFIDMQIKSLHSPKTKEAGLTRMYFFRREDSEDQFIVTGKAMLDDQMDQLSIAETGLDLESGGVEKFRGSYLRIERGDDKTTNTTNTLGTYEVTLYE